MTYNKCSPNRVGARGINVPWEGVVLSLNLHEDMLDKFPGVNKSPEWDQPACERCHSRQLSETYPVWSSNTKKLEVCKETKFSNTCKKSHVIFTFTSWHKVLTPIEPCLDILSDRNVWQFEKFETPSYTPFGRWHSPERSLRNQSPKIWFSSRPLPAYELKVQWVAQIIWNELLGRVCNVWRSSVRELGHK